MMKTRTEVLEALKGIDLVEDFSLRERSMMADSLRPEEFADGEVIVREGDTDGRFFIVTQGNVVAKANGRKLATFGPGQYFGEVALIDRGPRTATVSAVGAVATLSVASFTFRPLLKSNPDLQHKLLLKLCERLRAADKRLIG